MGALEPMPGPVHVQPATMSAVATEQAEEEFDPQLQQIVGLLSSRLTPPTLLLVQVTLPLVQVASPRHR